MHPLPNFKLIIVNVQVVVYYLETNLQMSGTILSLWTQHLNIVIMVQFLKQIELSYIYFLFIIAICHHQEMTSLMDHPSHLSGKFCLSGGGALFIWGRRKWIYTSRTFPIFLHIYSFNIFSLNLARYSDLIEKINTLSVNGDCVEPTLRYIHRFPPSNA